MNDKPAGASPPPGMTATEHAFTLEMRTIVEVYFPDVLRPPPAAMTTEPDAAQLESLTAALCTMVGTAAGLNDARHAFQGSMDGPGDQAKLLAWRDRIATSILMARAQTLRLIISGADKGWPI